MDLGFETIGNATLICHDRGPLLVTDPWLGGDAYFGSWTVTHEIPAEQEEAALACRFVWVSHGHPDHLDAASMRRLIGKTILLPDHVGGRIATALQNEGHTVRVLPERTWTSLSDRVRVCCVSDINQDALLMVDMDGRLVVNLNDASDHGWRAFVRRTVRQYDQSFLMQLTTFGDADMINLFDESGQRIPVPTMREPVGRRITNLLGAVGARYFVPFSSAHMYQRTDSVWANEYVVPLEQYSTGFDASAGELLSAFIRYDCITDEVTPLDPPRRELEPRPPSAFGDNWDEPLERVDVEAVESYFRAIRHLERHFGFIGVVVGGEEHLLKLGNGRVKRGITFAAPRQSLMTAVRHRVFDDMLIGNFMRTTLHGTVDPFALYPDFTPYVGKYADNANARTNEELRAYFGAYRRRDPVGYLRHRLERSAIDRFRSFVEPDAPLYRRARTIYHLGLRRSGRGSSTRTRAS